MFKETFHNMTTLIERRIQDAAVERLIAAKEKLLWKHSKSALSLLNAKLSGAFEPKTSRPCNQMYYNLSHNHCPWKPKQ